MKKYLFSLLCLLSVASGPLLAQKNTSRLSVFIGGGLHHSQLSFPDQSAEMQSYDFDSYTGYVLRGYTDLAFRQKLKNAFLRLELSYFPTKYSGTKHEYAPWMNINDKKLYELHMATWSAHLYANYHLFRLGQKGRVNIGVGGGVNTAFPDRNQLTTTAVDTYGRTHTWYKKFHYEPAWKNLSARVGFRSERFEVNLTTTLGDSFQIDPYTEANQRIISATVHYRL